MEYESGQTTMDSAQITFRIILWGVLKLLELLCVEK